MEALKGVAAFSGDMAQSGAFSVFVN